MPELKQPQEAAETTTEQPLTTKKKRAMLEYMAIMFAAAFLLVAISLLIKVIDMKGEMEAANTGARENIALLQKELDAARAEAEKIVSDAQAMAERSREKIVRQAGQDVKDLAAEATEKLVLQSGGDAFDQFLDLAEKEAQHEQS